MHNERDFAWLNEHGPEIFREYRGKWIAVHDGRIVGVGDTATEAAEQARRSVPEGDFVLEGVDFEADAIYVHS